MAAGSFINKGRRALFAKIGGAALALPFLHEFERQARAQGAKPDAPTGAKVAKNLIIFYTPNGVYHPAYWPMGGERDFKLNIAMEPLEKYKDKLIIVGPQFAGADRRPTAGTGLKHNVRNMGAGGNPPQHQAQVFLTGDPVRVGYNQQRGDGLTVKTSHPSLDQLVANKVGGKNRFKSLEFGIHPVGGDTPSSINFAMDGAPMPRMTDAAAAWKRIFEGITDRPAGGGMATPVGPDKRRVAVSNYVHKRFAALQPRLGREDRASLEGHMTAIREVESRILQPNTATAACEPSKVMLQEVPNGAAFANVPATASNFESMIALAFACDLTRVATVTFGYPGGGGVGGLHPVWLGINDAHHAMSHHGNSPDKTGKLSKLMNWFGLQVAQTLDQLAKYQHPEGGSLLDNSLVFWGSRHGEGNGHTNESIPALLAGGGGGAFGPTGRFLNLPGTNWCNLLLSLARGYGVQMDSYGLGPLKTAEAIKELAPA